MTDLHYLKLLAEKYKNSQEAAAEIINLTATLLRPKGTEYFFSDLHGEYEEFLHQLKSASGVIKRKIDELFFETVSEKERIELANLIYYPEEMMREKKEDFEDWFRVTTARLLEVCAVVSEKSTRAKVRQKAPKEFSHIIDELLNLAQTGRRNYYSGIFEAIMKTGAAEKFISGLCRMIRELAIDKLHIIGDIFDRGPRADIIMDELMSFHDVDIQWGNHDISWLGAYCGNLACVASVIRIGISYNNFDCLEDGYGINLRPLSEFAERVYENDDCKYFMPHVLDENKYDPVNRYVAARMHKAIAVIMFKLEGALYKNHPEYNMDDRLLLDKISKDGKSITILGKTYALRDTNFPTVDFNNPYKLTDGELEVINSLAASFRHSEKLKKHMSFLFNKGSMFLCCNGNLLYHGCIPMTEQGEFDCVSLGGEKLSGRKYLEYIDALVKRAYTAPFSPWSKNDDRDFFWYLWCGPKSPLFGKSKLSAFERYFICDESLCKEDMNPYYKLIENRSICEKIIEEFGLNTDTSAIVNGHVPVKPGQSPIKGGGLLYMIDGGISKAYQKKTGIGGYTFISSSTNNSLAKHMPHEKNNEKQTPVLESVKLMTERVMVSDTDEGTKIKQKINELSDLIFAFKNGEIKEISRHL